MFVHGGGTKTAATTHSNKWVREVVPNHVRRV